MFLFYFKLENVVFRIHITRIDMKFRFQKHITLSSLIGFLFPFDRSKPHFQYTSFCSSSKNLKIVVALSSRKVKIVEKPRNLVHFDYLSSKAWFLSMMCLNFRKDTTKIEITRIFQSYRTSFRK